MKETTVDGLNVNMGIWVDVFPYYPTDKNNVRKRIKWLQLVSKAYLLKLGYRINAITPSKINIVANNIISFSITLLTEKHLRSLYEKLISGLYSDSPELYLEIDGRFKGQFLFDKDVFDSIELGEFENTTFPIPAEYDKYLKKAYGNYMELPPVDLRNVGHSLTEVYFERNIDYYFENK